MKRKPGALQEDESHSPSGEDIVRAAETLVRGGVVAFPTETCYGLAVDPFNEDGLEKLFRLKGRPASKPVLLLIGEPSQLSLLAAQVPSLYPPLMQRYWPGPLTLIFPARSGLSPFLTGGTGTVGVRISPHPAAKALIRAFGRPITATSANLSGFPPARSVPEICRQFGESVDFILDGGTRPESLCSTIVSQSEGRLRLVRSGVIHVADISLL